MYNNYNTVVRKNSTPYNSLVSNQSNKDTLLRSFMNFAEYLGLLL